MEAPFAVCNANTPHAHPPDRTFANQEHTMRYKLVEQNPRTYVLIFNTGDELAAGLKQFASEQKLSGSSFKAIGALSSAKLGWFNWETKKYHTVVDLDEQVELLSLIGDIAVKDGEPQVHAHVVIGRCDGTAHGGHLQQANVRPTCEVVLTESPAHLQKQMDPESGIALIAL
jgi:predicted DNA-binding protein with PD1-like motif